MAFLEGLDRSVAPMVRGLEMRNRRHSAIAANVANVDTPGYRAVDITFEAELDGARLRLATTDPRHRSGRGAAQGIGRPTPVGGQPRRDGNDVDIDREMIKLAENQIEYQFLARALGGHFRRIKEAITGRATA